MSQETVVFIVVAFLAMTGWVVWLSRMYRRELPTLLGRVLDKSSRTFVGYRGLLHRDYFLLVEGTGGQAQELKIGQVDWEAATAGASYQFRLAPSGRYIAAMAVVEGGAPQDSGEA